MIEVIVKEYDGWFGVLEVADLYGVIDLDWELREIESEEFEDCRLDAMDAVEDYCLMGLARRGVVFEL